VGKGVYINELCANCGYDYVTNQLFTTNKSFYMKQTTLLLLLLMTTLILSGQTNKHDLFCQKWIQFGYKSHSDSNVRIITDDCSKKKCEFFKDGKYTEDMFCLKGFGIWAFNKDSTKFGFKYTEYMGQKIEEKLPISFNSLILKLTVDTLIIGNEGYYGNNKIYGHDDLYFVRVKK